MTEYEANIVSKAKSMRDWMHKHGWDKVKKCPDPVAAEFGFNELLMELCNAVDTDV